MAEELKLGSIVKSKAGHDRGSLLVVIGIEAGGEMLILADGKRRNVQKPKRKKLRHVIPTDGYSQRVGEILLSSGRLENSLVKKELKEYVNLHLKETGGC